MKIFKTILALIVAILSYGQTENKEMLNLIQTEANRAQSLFSIQANPNTLNYDVTYQELRFTLNPNSAMLNGIVKTTFTALANMNTIVFDFNSNMTVSNVSMNSTNLTFAQNGQELTINFPSTINQGTSNSVTITYSGTPSNAQGAYTQGAHGTTPIIYTLSEPYGARDWFPCKQDLNDKINSIDVYITAPSNYKSVSNGLEMSRTINGANATTHFRHLYPIPAYLIVMNVTNYDIYNQQAGLGTPQSPFFPIVNYLYPEDNNATTQNQLAATVQIMNLYEQLLEPYPFRNEKYGHAQFGWGGGMEHTTVSSMGNFSRDLIAHEMAHQWFGDKITCGTWKDIWLNEGLTEYMSGLVFENIDGTASFVNWKNNKITSITSQTSGYVYLQDSDLTNVNRIFSSRLTYNKGSMVTHMLRWKLGDTNFFQALRNYLADPSLSYGYAVTTNLKSHLEAVYGNSLTEFFNDWVYNQGYPTYNITVQNWGAGQAKITVNQTQSHASVSYFEMPLQIRLTGNGGLTHDVIVDNTTNSQEFIVNVPFVVTGAQFDPNKHIISKNNNVTLGNEEFILENAITFYPNPTSSTITLQTPNDIEIEQIEIYNMLGQIIWKTNDKTIDISNFSSGAYITKVFTNNGIVIKNIIKK